jgi:hypothetical protein
MSREARIVKAGLNSSAARIKAIDIRPTSRRWKAIAGPGIGRQSAPVENASTRPTTVERSAGGSQSQLPSP